MDMDWQIQQFNWLHHSSSWFIFGSSGEEFTCDISLNVS